MRVEELAEDEGDFVSSFVKQVEQRREKRAGEKGSLEKSTVICEARRERVDRVLVPDIAQAKHGAVSLEERELLVKQPLS